MKTIIFLKVSKVLKVSKPLKLKSRLWNFKRVKPCKTFAPPLRSPGRQFLKIVKVFAASAPLQNQIGQGPVFDLREKVGRKFWAESCFHLREKRNRTNWSESRCSFMGERRRGTNWRSDVFHVRENKNGKNWAESCFPFSGERNGKN